ncbi:hypothetical protein Tco_1447467 [Tanacetum coccineum]
MKKGKKREETESPVRWTRGNEAKNLSKKTLKNKQEHADAEGKRKRKENGKAKVVDLEEDDDESYYAEMNEKQYEKNEKVKNVKKQKVTSVLKGRAIVRPLFEAVRGLSPQRKKVIREMGFGDLIDFPIVDILTKLAFFVVDILNTKKNGVRGSNARHTEYSKNSKTSS